MQTPLGSPVYEPEERWEQCPFCRSSHILKSFAKGRRSGHTFYCDTLMIRVFCYSPEGLKRLLRGGQRPPDGTVPSDA